MSPIRRTTATLSTLALLLSGGLLAGSPAIAAPLAPAEINVMDAPYNAVGDGVTSDSVAIQNALDDAAGTGGTVLIPASYTFLTGGVIVGSDSTLKVDGTLLQSQNAVHYTYTPAKDHRPGPLKNDLSSFQNLPFVFATESENVKIIGDGVIQLTRAATDGETIHAVGVGLFEVAGFEIRDVDVLGASSYTVALYSSRDGIVANTRVIPGDHYGTMPDVADANTDGVSIMNTQNVRITGNYIRASDDGIYIWANYLDPRSVGRWWYKEEPKPSRFIEFDNNDVAITCCKAFTFIVWGIDAPDQRTVEISDIYVHDNKLSATDAVGCWCDARYPNSAASEGQSPVTRITFENNEYIGNVNTTFATAQITDLKTDFGALGSQTLMNGDFEKTGIAWWSSDGTNSDNVGAIDATDTSVLRSAEAREAIDSLDGFVGFVQTEDSATARLYQGLGLAANVMPEVPFPTNVYELSADVVTGDAPARLFAYDSCTERVLAQTSVAADSVERASLFFRVDADCGNIQLGIETSGSGAWALMDNVVLTNAVQAIDNDDPRIVYTGTWKTYVNAGAWGGTNAIARNVGSVVDIPFTGTRGVLLALKDYNLGMANAYLDGALVTTADFYAPTKQTGKLIYDTGELADGDHTIRIQFTNTKNPLSTGTIIVFDALLMPTVLPDLAAPALSLALSHAGENGWLMRGAEATLTATDDDSGVASVEHRLADGAWTSYSGPISLPDGQYSIEFHATDVAGNVSDTQSREVKVDTQLPSAWLWLSEGGVVSALARDAGPSGIDRIEYSLDDGDSWLSGLSSLIAEVLYVSRGDEVGVLPGDDGF